VKTLLFQSLVLLACLAGSAADFERGACGEYLIPQGNGTVYEVGPGQAYAQLGDVPMETLQGGDTIRVHWRATPYREKLLLGGQGTAANPIVVTGVPNANCELPVLDGNGATTRSNLNFPNQDRGVITVENGASKPTELTIANLEIRGGHPDNEFTDSNGQIDTYRNNASGINVVRGEHIHILGCEIHLNGNGIFVASYTGPDCENTWCANESYISRDILVEGNAIYDNSVVGRLFEHNVYTEALRMVFQYNYIGSVIDGGGGSSLKDRSAGTVIRYNWIEGTRPVDLVEPQFGEEVLYDAPEYDATLVYGNVIVKVPGAANDRIVHYGGDNGDTTRYRKGTLYFYHNTVVAKRDDSVVFGLETSDEIVDARNNIFYADGAFARFWLIDGQGTARLENNWMVPALQDSQGGGGSVTSVNATIGSDPGFADAGNDDYSIAMGSPVSGLAGVLHPAVQSPYPITHEYVVHTQCRFRSDVDDLGAFADSRTNPSVMPVIIFSDIQKFVFGGGQGSVAMVTGSGGVRDSAAIKYDNIAVGSSARLGALDFSAAPLRLDALTADDYLILGIDLGSVASPLNGVRLYLNGQPEGNTLRFALPEIDNETGFQTVILPVDGIRTALGNQLLSLVLDHPNWPVGTLCLDELRFVRTEDMHPIDAQRLLIFGLQVNRADAQDTGDFDGDGFSNFQEIAQGTDPTSGASIPASAVGVLADADYYRFELRELAGIRSTVQRSTNLTDWTELATRDGIAPWVVLAPNDALESPRAGIWRLRDSSRQARAFYRTRFEKW